MTKDPQTNKYFDPLEFSISRELWRWLDSTESVRVAICSPRSSLSGSIEYYLSNAFEYESSAPSHGWWCDGVIALSIQLLDQTSFLLRGAAHWDKSGRQPSPSGGLAPYEIELFYSAVNADTPTRSIVRFGAVDHEGNILCTSSNRCVEKVLENFPQCNADWAFAVELTNIDT